MYYLKRAEPLLPGRRAANFPNPSSARSTFTIVAGSLTYIGDWSIRWLDVSGPSIDYKIERKTVDEILSKRDFSKLPLYIAQIGQSPVRVKRPD